MSRAVALLLGFGGVLGCGYDQSGDWLSRNDGGKIRTHSGSMAHYTLSEGNVLLVLDNSRSMAVWHESLEELVVQLVGMLDYDEVRVGLITSSLGGHGSRTCPRDDPEHNYDDRAHLLPFVRQDAPDPEGTGFLRYTRRGNLEVFRENLHAQLAAVGTRGCPFPAPLEAAYRFLIDPEPPEQIVLTDAGKSSPTGLDEDLLAQREAFLFPQGPVMVIMATDQDDCSLMDGGAHSPNAERAYLALDPDYKFASPSRTCAENPNSLCCFSCGDSIPPECDADECAEAGPLPPEADRFQVRCFDQKRRFGMDLHFPPSRYVDGFTQPRIVSARSGETFDNPLLQGAGKNAGIARSPYRTVVVGITGVPWQNVATSEALSDPSRFSLRRGYELTDSQYLPSGSEASAWDLMLGTPGRDAASPECLKGDAPPDCGAVPVPPADPFMIPSIPSRKEGSVHPIVRSEAITSPDSGLFNTVNGHEMNTLAQVPDLYEDGGALADRLQFSAMGYLNLSLECAAEEEDCPCSLPELKSPLCRETARDEFGSTQYWAGAVPAPRILSVLRDLGHNALVAPVIPKVNTGDPTNPDFGYNAVLGILRLFQAEEPQTYHCGPSVALDQMDGGCLVTEVHTAAASRPDCGRPGRTEMDPKTRELVQTQMHELGLCGALGLPACDSFSMCLVEQLQGEEAQACVEWPLSQLLYGKEPAEFSHAGYCVVPQNHPSVEDLCWSPTEAVLKFVGEDTPLRNTTTLIACEGGPVIAENEIPAPPTGR